jgi:hypothetical protein
VSTERLPLPTEHEAGPQREGHREPQLRVAGQWTMDRGVPVLLFGAFEEPPFGERLVIIILHCQHIAVATHVQIANLYIIH